MRVLDMAFGLLLRSVEFADVGVVSVLWLA